MGIKSSKPTSPGKRFQTTSTFEDITRKKPEKSLLKPLNKKGGRNANGRMTSRHRGGGHKRAYRVIDFKRDKDGIPAKVAFIEYDPNRSANIALLHYVDGEKRYILAPKNISVGDRLTSGEGSEIRIGNALPLKSIPLGTHVHNIELNIGHGGQLARGGWKLLPVNGQGRQLRTGETPLWRGSAHPTGLQGNHRSSRESGT